MAVIYGIAHKANDKVFYVGQTRASLADRWREHWKGRTPLSRALQVLGTKDCFEIRAIETVEPSELNDREDFWITYYETLHPNGLNMRRSGSRAFVSDKTRERMSSAKKKQWADPEFRKRAVAGLRASITEERRAKHRAAALRQMARGVSAETRLRMSQSAKARCAKCR